jgi:hypothetical protein
MNKFIGSAFLCLAGAVMIGCGRSPESEAPATDAPAAPTKGMHNSYSLQWVSNDVPAKMAPGAAVPIKVSVKNTGDWPWPDPFTANPSHPDGTYAVRLTYGWATADGKVLPDPTRGEIAAPVPPDQTANFSLTITAPKQPGSYQLKIDLVEELVTFFSAKGTEKLVVPVTVQ